jgi:dihydroorotate dehydrogenase
MYFISAPFGNYLHRKDTISVTGSWTLNRRSGLAKQIVKTLRYIKTDAGWSWRNKIGLRNAGIYEGLERTQPNDVMSLAAIDEKDWQHLYMIVPYDKSVEINISCPNLDKDIGASDLKGFDLWTTSKRPWCICKIPPTSSNKLVDKIVDAGYKQIHASNTLYTESGGLSGRTLTPYTLKLIDYIKNTHSHVEIVAGGGVYTKEDAQRYIDAGADHISLGTVCFTPWRLRSILI